MKQIWPNYSYSPTTNVLTLTGLNIDRDQLLLVTAADRGRIMYNFADSSVTASAFTSGANTALTLVATTAGLTTTAALVIYYDDQVASNSVTGTVELGPTSLNALESITVTMGQVTVTGGLTDTQLRASAVTIAGTVTANGLAVGATVANVFPIGVDTQFSGVRTVTDLIGYRLPISLGDSSAVVSASLYEPLPAGTNRIGVVTIGAGTVTIGAGTAQIGSVTASISGTVPISISSVTVGNSVTIGSLPAISGTVTANSSNGSLTTRFGSVTTANTAFATSAVTNSNRKYLLIQNITTSSNVITVGVGFIPTTTQGIQLAAGAGLTFEGSYIPTGAVNLLSSVTASCFTILEA